MWQMLQKGRRAEKLTEIVNNISPEKHDFLVCSKKRREASKAHKFVPSKLPSDNEILKIITESLHEAIGDAIQLGISVEYLKVGLETYCFPRTELNEVEEIDPYDVESEQINEERDKMAADIASAAEGTGQHASLTGDGSITEQEIFLADIMRCNLVEDLSAPPAPRGFVKVHGPVQHLRKSTVLWTLTLEKQRLSSDRLQRFITEKRNVFRKNDSVFISHFVIMFVPEQNANEIVMIMGFKTICKAKKDESEIMKSMMSLKDKKGERVSSVGAIVNLYRKKMDDDNIMRLYYIRPIEKQISLIHFVRHVENDELYSILNPVNTE